MLLAELIEAGTLGLTVVGGNVDAKVNSAPSSDFNITGLSTIELGAGIPLPSIMSTLLGARRVVVTDYLAPVVIDTLKRNVATNTLPSCSPSGHIIAAAEDGVEVEGHSWGELETPLAVANKQAFDRVFVADCLWMPW